MNSEKIKAWFFLFRPWSYTATLVPFLVGLIVTSFKGRFDYWALGLICGLFFQATVNLLNTWGDERSGVDSVPGAIRTTPQVHEGYVSMRALFIASTVCAVIASILGISLCFYFDKGTWHFNWLLLAAGFIGCLGSLNYSTGIKFKYRGLGVPFVSFLMGPLEIFVVVALLRPDIACFSERFMPHLTNINDVFRFALISLPIASLVGVIMHGNDMRDIPTDRAAGIVTLSSWLGARGALTYYNLCHVIAHVAVMASCIIYKTPALLSFLILPLTFRTLKTAIAVYRENPSNPMWRGLEKGSGKIHFLFGILYTLSFYIFSR